MDSLLELILQKYEIFLYVFVRTSGVFLISPFFSSQNIPNGLKVGLVTSMSFLLALVVPIPEVMGNSLLILIIQELMVGLIIGFIGYLFFTSFYVMGQIIDMKIGFAMVNVIDPQSKVQVPLMGNFYYTIAFLLLLGVNGHHMIISALVDSYEFIPIGSFVFDENMLNLIISGLVKAFEIGFKLSTPIVACIFLTDLILGVMARTIPQMNVFVVGMPLKLLVGLLVIIIGMSSFVGATEKIFDIIVNDLYKFLRMGQG